MTVYIVTQGIYSDYRIIAVFEEKELANEFATDLEKKSSFYDEVRVETWNTAGEKYVDPDFSAYGVTMDEKGEANAHRDRIELIHLGARHFEGTVYCTVLARSPEHAIKIVNERRIYWLASGWKWEDFKIDGREYYGVD